MFYMYFVCSAFWPNERLID